MKRTWEYIIYKNQADFDNIVSATREGYYTNKKVCLHESRVTLKNMKLKAPIVKIQSNDREVIEIYVATIKFGNVIFTPVK